MRKFIRYIIPLTLLFTICNKKSFCNTVKLFNNSYNLSSKLINNINQDSIGFIWLATEYGLNRFDGKQFKNYFSTSENKKLHSNFVNVTYTDKKGNLWIGTNKSLQKYNYQTDSIENVNPTSLALQVTSITDDNSDNIWVISDSGIIQYSTKNNEINIHENLNSTLKPENINCIFIDSEDFIWIGTKENGLYSYDQKTSKLTHINKLSAINISSITGVGNEIYGTSTSDNCIFYYNTETKIAKKTTYTYENKTISYNLIYIDSQKHILVGSDGHGLFELNPKTFFLSKTIINSKSFNFDKCKINSIIEDKFGNIWLGIFNEGLVLLDNSIFNNFTHNNNPIYSIGSESISAIAETNNFIWIGTNGDGLYCINKDDNTTKHIKLDYVNGNNILSIFAENNYTIWIGSSSSGIIKYDTQLELASKINYQDISNITAIKEYNSKLLIGTLNNKLYEFNKSTGLFNDNIFISNEVNAKIPNQINGLQIDSSNNIWIASNNGVFCVDSEGDKITSYSNSNALLPTNLTYCIYEDGFGDIWAGTHNGLVNISENRTYYTSNGLENNTICAISSDIENTLWVSTYNGLSYLKHNSHKFLSFNNTDGIINRFFCKNSVFYSSNGLLYFGGDNGVTSINPSKLNLNIPPSKVILTNINILDNNTLAKTKETKSITTSNTIKLKEKNNSFSINFISNDLKNQSKFNYLYKLDGFNNNWIEASNINIATYTNIKSGTYIFRVKSVYKNIESEEKTITIIISKAWYKNPILIIFIFILICSIFIFKKSKLKPQLDTEHKESENEFYEIELKLSPTINTQTRRKLPNTNNKKLNPQDKELLKKLTNYINTNISNDELSVEKIAREIGISRIHLYRRIKEITDVSAHDFIKNTRMEYAEKMLIKNDIKISEISHKLGFSSSSYFSKSFKAYYGMTPKEYATKMIDSNKSN